VSGLILTGAGVTVVAGFLPWVVAEAFGFRVTQTGFDVDGAVTVVLAAVAVGMVAVRLRDRIGMAVASVCGAGIVAVGGLYVADLAYGYDLVPASGIVETVGKRVADPAIGVYVTLLGGVLVLIGGLIGFAGGHRQDGETPSRRRRG